MKDKNLNIVIIVVVAIFIIVATIGIMVAVLKDKSESKPNIDNMVFSTTAQDKNNETITKLEDEYRGMHESIYDVEYEYTIEKAKNDENFVKVHMDTYNDEIYNEFIDKYNGKESAFLRKVSVTIEGEIIIEDYIYDSVKDIVYVIEDTRRDTYMSEEDRRIKVSEYDNPNNNQEWNDILKNIK